MAYFECKTDNTYDPEYGGIRWRELRLRHLGESGLEAAEVWFVHPDEDIEIQVTQESSVIYVNEVEPCMDRIDVVDPRDDLPWIFYRDESDTFDDSLMMIRGFAMIIHTMYPLDSVVATYLERRMDEMGI